jgi:hypothetical protein
MGGRLTAYGLPFTALPFLKNKTAAGGSLRPLLCWLVNKKATGRCLWLLFLSAIYQHNQPGKGLLGNQVAK